MNFLHEGCEGAIETFDDDNYGCCSKCGEEGYFQVTREGTDYTAYVIFYYVVCIREVI